jgi:site-specific DNA-methyltransferase (adenine-specific)
VMDLAASDNYVILGDNADVLPTLPDRSFQLIYIDPPFNTGIVQQRRTLLTERDDVGDRTGFQGKRYSTIELGRLGYSDIHDDYLGFISDRLKEAHRLLADDGTLYFHIDYREVHYCKVLLDSIFGRECFLNEVIWAYDYGGRGKDRWPAKHDNILVYVKQPKAHYFNQEQIERIPYMAPGLVSAEKAAHGKLPTDVWWQTIVPTNGKEKTGYPNQKPEAIMRRIISASSAPGSRVLDFFAGSGTTGAVAMQLGRRFLMIDDNPGAIATMRRRLGDSGTRYLGAHGSALNADATSAARQTRLL